MLSNAFDPEVQKLTERLAAEYNLPINLTDTGYGTKAEYVR
jgi:hypothetical protein